VSVTPLRRPAWLASATEPGAFAFALLFAVESASRATIVSVVPIQAFDLIRDEQRLSAFYFAVGGLGMCATLAAPILFQRFPRRVVYTIGALLLIVAGALFATHTLVGQAAGMFMRILAASTLAIALNLYIMDYIPKQGFVESESLRLTLATLAWTVGPSFGVWLYVRFGYVAPYLWSATWACLLIALFWHLRLSGNPAIKPGKNRPVNPIANVRRFVAQPRLRLAWLIAFGRSCYWMTFYIYAPILMVATGQGKLAGGIVVSLGNAVLILSLAWGKLGVRLGVRTVVVLSFAGVAVCGILAGVAGEGNPWPAAVILLAGTVFAVALDAVGSAPYLRAVHAYERPQMTAVYRTNLDLSELLPPLVYAIILSFTGLGGVFVTVGLFAAICGVLSWRYLPRSM
jgi:MFS family permease